MNQNTTKAEKLAELRRSIESADAEPIFDAEYEKQKAKVRHRALLLLDHRSRSIHELIQRLLAAEFEPELVTDVVEDLVRCGLLDDEAFAVEWVRQRHTTRGKSRKALKLELEDKGVRPEHIAQALSTIAGEDETDMAEQIALKKARTFKSIPADRREYDKLLARLVGVMARRGYPQSICMDVGRRVLDERIIELKQR